jgi:hypothetical protein
MLFGSLTISSLNGLLLFTKSDIFDKALAGVDMSQLAGGTSEVHTSSSHSDDGTSRIPPQPPPTSSSGGPSSGTATAADQSSRQSNLQRIQQRKQQVYNWPHNKKLLKLAIYSACQVIIFTLLGTKIGNTRPWFSFQASISTLWPNILNCEAELSLCLDCNIICIIHLVSSLQRNRKSSWYTVVKEIGLDTVAKNKISASAGNWGVSSWLFSSHAS